MIKLLIRFGLILAAAACFSWLADQNGVMELTVAGYQIKMQLVKAALLLLIGLFVLWVLFGLLARLFNAPGAMFGFFSRRKERKGREALSRGLIAVGSGDADMARRNASVAASSMPKDPLAKLLQAQAAQMSGDHKKVTRLFEDMRDTPETELMGLRGLYVQARKEGNDQEADSLARRASTINPSVDWASSAVLLIQAREGDWPALLNSVEDRRKARLIDDEEARRQRAVVMTAQALTAEEVDQDVALDFANRAHRLDPSLVPAAVVAGRIQSGHNNLRKASKILEKTWSLNPHPDIAEVYMFSRSGDSVRDRLARMQQLRRVSKGGEEGAIALALAAIDARDWKIARDALSEYTEAPRVRVCTLMAEIEQGEFGDKGRAREWLGRAVRAPRDPSWTADGYVAEEWAPVSPITGELGAFKWRVPVEGIGYSTSGGELDTDLLAAMQPDKVVEEPVVMATAVGAATVTAVLDNQPVAKSVEELAEAQTVEPLEELTEEPPEEPTDEPVEDIEVVEPDNMQVDTKTKISTEADTEADTDDRTAQDATDEQDIAIAQPQETGNDEIAPSAIDGDKGDVELSGEDKVTMPLRQPDDPGLDERMAKKRRGWFG